MKERLGLEFPKRSSIEDCVSAIRTLLTEAADTENAPEKMGGYLKQRFIICLLNWNYMQDNMDRLRFMQRKY